MTLLTASRPARKLTSPRASFTGTFSRLHGLWRQRQALKALDDAALKDIGVTRDQAHSEAKRPVWDAPINWLR